MLFTSCGPGRVDLRPIAGRRASQINRMNKTISVTTSKKIYIIISIVCVASSIVLFPNEELGNTEDKILGIGLLVLYLFLVALSFAGKVSAKWILTAVVSEFGIIFLSAGFQISSINFIFLGLIFLTTAAIPHIFKPQTEPKKSSRKLVKIEGETNIHGQYEIPMLTERFKAFLIDLLIVLNITTFFNKIFILFDSSNDEYSLQTYIIILLIYEVSLTTHSHTLGQYAMNYRITKFMEPTQKISIIQAIIRTLSKYLLGIGTLSAIAAAVSKKQRALHDLISRTIAIGTKNDAQHSV